MSGRGSTSVRSNGFPEPELLFEFYRPRDHKMFRCELRDLGKWGVDARFFEGGDLVLGHRFESVTKNGQVIFARTLAIEWATAERDAILFD